MAQMLLDAGAADKALAEFQAILLRLRTVPKQISAQVWRFTPLAIKPSFRKRPITSSGLWKSRRIQIR